jgi:hypothetical protein
MKKIFAKILTANDVGDTGSHQAGICVPKSKQELLSFFPILDSTNFNPETWLDCIDADGQTWAMRYIYYNGKIHGKNTRNEYRITHMTKLFKKYAVKAGDEIFFTKEAEGHAPYYIDISSQADQQYEGQQNTQLVLQLRGWRQIH